MSDDRPLLTEQQIKEGWSVAQHGGMWVKTLDLKQSSVESKIRFKSEDPLLVTGRVEPVEMSMSMIEDTGYDGSNGEAFIAKVRTELEANRNTVLSRGAGLALLHEIEKANAGIAAQRARADQEERGKARLYAHFQALASKINRVRAALCAKPPSIDSIREIVDE